MFHLHNSKNNISVQNVNLEIKSTSHLLNFFRFISKDAPLNEDLFKIFIRRRIDD